MPTDERTYDYEAADVLTVREPAQLRALADARRARIVALLRERAASTTELAGVLGLPKGTVGHHVKVLERAGLIRVVRTRRVRALTEKLYGRTARLFVLKGDEDAAETPGGALAAVLLRQAADELLATGPTTDESAFVHARLTPADAKRLTRRLGRLIDDVLAADRPGGQLYGFAVTAFPTTQALPPRDDA